VASSERKEYIDTSGISWGKGKLKICVWSLYEEKGRTQKKLKKKKTETRTNRGKRPKGTRGKGVTRLIFRRLIYSSHETTMG